MSSSRPSPPSPQPEAPREIGVIVAVQPALWAELLVLLLCREPGIRVLGRAATEDEITALVAGDQKSVVLFDFEALGPYSAGIVARLHRSAPRARTLVLARRSGEETVTLVLRAGAAGLLGKEAEYATLLTAVRAVAAGQIWAKHSDTAHVIEQLIATKHAAIEDSPDLTRREWEVVDAVGRGLRSSEIAATLGISPKTVKTHLSNIFAKTQLRGRFALALWAQGQLQPKA